MSKIYSDVDGSIIRLLVTIQEEQRYPDPPPGAANFLELDQTTNEPLIRDMKEFHNSYTLLSGVVRKDGVVQTVNPDSSEELARKQLKFKLDPTNPPLTQNELKAILRLAFKEIQKLGGLS